MGFIERVLERMPKGAVRDYEFHHWSVPGKPTDEAVGVLAVPEADAERVLARVMDVDRYVGNVGHVVESRAIADAAYQMPKMVRFYQRIKIPLLGEVHHEIVLERIGERDGWEIAQWHMLERETEALSKKLGMRSQYSDGAWLVRPGIVGYALSSAPRRDDVGLLKWKALTTGADVAASKVIRENIDGMARWAARG